ncbi:MAG TPA: hypothetical protein VEG34_01435, partial [Thermoanaerobaculia bacterium]|nr:hypothetical protein [Thermoanaerobaculia bacterium]
LSKIQRDGEPETGGTPALPVVRLRRTSSPSLMRLLVEEAPSPAFPGKRERQEIWGMVCNTVTVDRQS